MTHDLRNPTSIAGKDFPSLTHAAKHFGVSPNTVMYYIVRGREHDFVDKHAVSVTINSVRYRSLHRASLATGIPLKMFLTAKRNGKLRDFVKTLGNKS